MMYPKIKTKVLKYSRLNLGISNDVYPYNFLFITTMDGQSNREVLEIFNTAISYLKPASNLPIISDF